MPGSRTVKFQICGDTPATTYWANSPSSVLQIQPRRENFCSTPARVPSEYAHERENQVQRPTPAIASSTTIMRKRANPAHPRGRRSDKGTSIGVMLSSLDERSQTERRLAAELGRGLTKNPRNPLMAIWYPKSKHRGCPRSCPSRPNGPTGTLYFHALDNSSSKAAMICCPSSLSDPASSPSCSIGIETTSSGCRTT